MCFRDYFPFSHYKWWYINPLHMHYMQKYNYLITSIIFSNSSFPLGSEVIGLVTMILSGNKIICLKPSDFLGFWPSDSLGLWPSDSLALWPSDSLGLWPSDSIYPWHLESVSFSSSTWTTSSCAKKKLKM